MHSILFEPENDLFQNVTPLSMKKKENNEIL